MPFAAPCDANLSVSYGSNVAHSLDQVSAYNYLTDHWFPKTPMPASLASVHAEVIGDKIYIFETDNTFEYTPASDIRR